MSVSTTTSSINHAIQERSNADSNVIASSPPTEPYSTSSPLDESPSQGVLDHSSKIAEKEELNRRVKDTGEELSGEKTAMSKELAPPDERPQRETTTDQDVRERRYDQVDVANLVVSSDGDGDFSDVDKEGFVDGVHSKSEEESPDTSGMTEGTPSDEMANAEALQPGDVMVDEPSFSEGRDSVEMLSQDGMKLATTVEDVVATDIENPSLSTTTTANAAIPEFASPQRPNKDGSLLRLFQSELFDIYFHMYYLQHRQEPGIHDYLVNLLYRRDEEDIHFYIPQIW